MRPVWLNAWSSCSVFSIIAVNPQLYLLYFAIREARLIVSAAGVQKFSHDCFYKTIMEDELRKLDLQSGRDRIVVTGIGSNNCVYHAVIGLTSEITSSRSRKIVFMQTERKAKRLR